MSPYPRAHQNNETRDVVPPKNDLPLEELTPVSVGAAPSVSIGTELAPRTRQFRLHDIARRYGITEADILARLHGKPTGVGKNAYKKFKRFLGSSDAVLSALGFKQQVSHTAFRDYYRAIERRIGFERMKDYRDGNWDDEITDAVRRALEEHVKPRRSSAKSEVTPRAEFRPRPDYHGGA